MWVYSPNGHKNIIIIWWFTALSLNNQTLARIALTTHHTSTIQISLLSVVHLCFIGIHYLIKASFWASYNLPSKTPQDIVLKWPFCSGVVLTSCTKTAVAKLHCVWSKVLEYNNNNGNHHSEFEEIGIYIQVVHTHDMNQISSSYWSILDRDWN